MDGRHVQQNAVVFCVRFRRLVYFYPFLSLRSFQGMLSRSTETQNDHTYYDQNLHVLGVGVVNSHAWSIEPSLSRVRAKNRQTLCVNPLLLAANAAEAFACNPVVHCERMVHSLLPQA